MALLGLFGSSETIYFPGCFTSSLASGKAENYKKILKRLDIDFSMAKDKDILCCGGFLEEAGYDKEMRKLARENLENLKKRGVKKIITSCPLCFHMLQNYKNLMPDWDIESEFAVNLILSSLIENDKLVRSYSSEPIAYYDSCYFPRYLGIVKQPREILKILGSHIIELPHSKENALCCGSCGNLPKTNSELSNKIAEDFIKMLKRRKIKKVVTADIRAYNHLKENLKLLGVSEEEIQVIELSDIICGSLGIALS